MATPSRKISVFPNGIYKVEYPNLQLYQHVDDIGRWGAVRGCAYTGCPAVMVLIDAPDTILTKDWQLYLVAINFGMPLNNIVSLMGDQKALTNDKEGDKANFIMEENLDGELPRLDKLRTFALNTHAGWDDGVYQYTVAMNGKEPPEMKINPNTGLPYPRPNHVSEIVPEHYKYLPHTHRHLFLDCNNVKVKADKSIGYGPFDNGIERPWIGDKRMHTFFPFVSRETIIRTPLWRWKKLPLGSAFPSPFS